MSTPLTTFDGFPRADVDVVQIRVTRARIIPLRNDYKALMAEIEKGLHEHHAAVAAGGSDGERESGGEVAAARQPAQQQQVPGDVVQLPFARVNSVAVGGPAEEAGLRVGDVVKRFGAATALNHNRLSRVAQEVEQNEGVGFLCFFSPPFLSFLFFFFHSFIFFLDTPLHVGTRK